MPRGLGAEVPRQVCVWYFQGTKWLQHDTEESGGSWTEMTGRLNLAEPRQSRKGFVFSSEMGTTIDSEQSRVQSEKKEQDQAPSALGHD